MIRKSRILTGIILIILTTGTLLFFQKISGNISVSASRETTSTIVSTEKEHVERKREEKKQLQSKVFNSVPFTSQAPNGDWSNPLFQDGCEEASIMMAMAWVRGEESTTQDEATKEILAMAEFTDKNFGHFLDLSADDTAKLMRSYYGYENVRVTHAISSEDIKKALYRGSIVIIPADGRKLGNPHFTQPGPENHMLVIIGYNPETDAFTTNDPGTKHGAGYEYPESVIDNAIRDYPTGHHEPNPNPQTAMIEVWK